MILGVFNLDRAAAVASFSRWPTSTQTSHAWATENRSLVRPTPACSRSRPVWPPSNSRPRGDARVAVRDRPADVPRYFRPRTGAIGTCGRAKGLTVDLNQA